MSIWLFCMLFSVLVVDLSDMSVDPYHVPGLLCVKYRCQAWTDPAAVGLVEYMVALIAIRLHDNAGEGHFVFSTNISWYALINSSGKPSRLSQ
jgi:hypothetical protein